MVLCIKKRELLKKEALKIAAIKVFLNENKKNLQHLLNFHYMILKSMLQLTTEKQTKLNKKKMSR